MPSSTFIRPAKLCLLALLSLGIHIATAQTTFLDFNTAGQYLNNFSLWTPGGSSSFQESAAAGVNGSGGVNVFQSADTTAVYKSGSWNLATNGAAITISTMVKANSQTSTDKAQLGILNSHTNGLNDNAGVAFESFRFIPTSPTVWSLRERYRANGALMENTLGTVNCTAGH